VKDDFAKLLRCVDPDAKCGFGFEGVLLKPGSTLTAAELRPSAEYPAAPVVLEMARVLEDAPAAQRRYEDLVVLWRYSRERAVWIELGRARSKSWEWAIELRAIAVRAIEEQRVRVQVVVNVVEIQARIVTAIERELAGVFGSDRWRVLSVVHDEIARGLTGAKKTASCAACVRSVTLPKSFPSC
jgi:hypothetical protein